MGTAGSVEQRNAIKDVIVLGDSSNAKKRNKDDIIQVLTTFCTVFPLETSTDEAHEGDENALDVKEKRLFDAVHRLLKTAVDTNAMTGDSDESDIVLLILETFKRLLQWRELHKLVPKYSIKPFLTCMMWSPQMALSVLEVILMMKTRPNGLKSSEIGDKIEVMNRRTFADDQGFQVLGSLLTQHRTAPYDNLSTQIMEECLRIFHWTYVASKSTSDAVTLDRITDALLNARLALLWLSHHPKDSLRILSVDLLLELFFVADLAQVTILQDAARDCGALLYMVYFAVVDDEPNVEGEDVESARDSSFRDKSIQLVEMFCAGNSRSKSAMYRILPVDLFVPIEDRPDLISKYSMASIKKSTNMTKTRSMDIMSFRETRFSASGSFSGTAKPVEFQRWLQDARSQGETWQQVMVAARQVHERPNLVWRRDMLVELQNALKDEIDRLNDRTDWDCDLFQVTYASFKAELVVHGYFIDWLIPKLADLNDSYEVDDLVVLAWHLSDRLGVEENPAWRRSCVRCLRLMMRRYAMTFNGQLPVAGLLHRLQTEALDPAFASECFLLFHVAISTARTRATDSLTSGAILTTVVATLERAMESATRLSSFSRASSTLSEADNDVHRLTFASLDDDVDVANEVDSNSLDGSNQGGGGGGSSGGLDAMLRAGINVLAVVMQRAKFFIPQVLEARTVLVRLFGAAFLSPRTIATLLQIIEQLLDNVQDANSFKRTLLPLVLVACSNPQNRGMCHASASFLSTHYTPDQFKTLVEAAVGHHDCGLHLVLSEPLLLAALFNSDHVRAADVIWGSAFRSRLFQYLSDQCGIDTTDGFHDAVDADETVVDVCIGHLFLRSFVEQEGTFRTKWTPKMYHDTIVDLLDKVGKSTFPSEDSSADPMEMQVLVLKALLVLIPRAGQSISIESRIFDTFLTPLKRSLLSEVDQARGGVGLKLFQHMLSPESNNVNAEACLDTLLAHGLDDMNDAIDKTLTPRYLQFVREQPPFGPALSLVTAIFDLAVTMAQLDRGLAALQAQPRFLARLFSLAMPHVVSSAPQIAQDALVCISRLCRYDALARKLLVESGGIVFLSQLCAVLDDTDGSHTTTMGYAAGILQTHGQNNQAVLIQLFTPGLVKMLSKDPSQFLQVLHNHDDLYSAQAIWTTTMQRQLKETLKDEVAKIQVALKAPRAWPVWDPDHFLAADSFRYLYPDVADEVLVSGIYIRLLAPKEMTSMEELVPFTTALLEDYGKTTAALNAMQSRGGFSQKLQDRHEQLRLAVRKIMVAHPQLEMPFEQEFSDTESVGDDISNLVDDATTKHSDDEDEQDQDEGSRLTKEESMQLDEIVV
ncbi:unnamed protein product [Aphanomyces euteiches]|nr:hypothetical protein AeRB84_001208 [Aphanomyces euteiches]